MSELQLSQNKIGFTSAMKVGFVFNEDSEQLNNPNHVVTQFNSTVKAVEHISNNEDTKVMVVDYKDSLTVVSIDEAKANALDEVTLKVIDRDTDNAKWISAFKNESELNKILCKIKKVNDLRKCKKNENGVFDVATTISNDSTNEELINIFHDIDLDLEDDEDCLTETFGYDGYCAIREAESGSY